MAAEEAPRIVHVDPTPPRVPLVTNLVRLLRVHQWVKNLLVFTPVLAAHAMRDPRPVRAAILAFVAVVVAVPLVGTGGAIRWALSPQVCRLIGFYVILSLAYSYVLKELGLVDV